MTIEEIAFGSAVYDEALRFRERHLREPLGLALSAADLAGEDQQIHIAAFEADMMVGTVVLKPVSARVVRLRQMAVAPHRRGTGLGSDLVRFAERLAASLGFSIVDLHARADVERFYDGLGYSRVGDPFVEMTIPHLAMTKTLDRVPRQQPPAV